MSLSEEKYNCRDQEGSFSLFNLEVLKSGPNAGYNSEKKPASLFCMGSLANGNSNKGILDLIESSGLR